MNKLYKNISDKDRQAVLEEVVSSLSHDIRNPLAAIKNGMFYVRHVLKDMDDKLRTNLNIMEKELNSVVEILDLQRDNVRRDPPERVQTSINSIIAKTSEMVDVPENVEISIDSSSEDIVFSVDRWELMVALYHILDNGVSFCAGNGGGTVSVKASVNGSGSLEISVNDTGPGTESPVRELCEPYFTTRQDRPGLGLTIACGIIERHKGELFLESAPSKGTQIRIELPA